MSKIEDSVEKIVMRLLEGQNEIELVDVEYVRERERYLRVFIDKTGGIHIDDCQNLSERLEAELDKSDLIKESYILEVSSPGLDRALKKPRDFEREKGKKIDISLYAPLDGKKETTGTLAGYDGESVFLDDGRIIPKDKISLVRLHIDI